MTLGRIVVKRGRPSFVPTAEQRRNVEIMAGLGIAPEHMRQVVRDNDGEPISLPALLRHFRTEIETSATKLKASVGHFIIATILGIAPPAGLKPITDDRVRGRLLQLFARAQLGWETTAKREIADPTGPGGRPIPFVYRASKRPSFGTPSSSSGAAGSEKAAFAMIEEALRDYRARAAAQSANNGP